MTDKTDNLWYFKYWDKQKFDRAEKFYCTHQLTKEEISRYPESVDHMRRFHRMEIMERITGVMYDGWMPLEMEWWEGYVDDLWVLKDYWDVRPGDDIYYFWTRLTVAAHDSVQIDRHATPLEDFGPTLTRYSPPTPR